MVFSFFVILVIPSRPPFGRGLLELCMIVSYIASYF